MRLEVEAPCWLSPGANGRALVVVIPDHSASAPPDARVEVGDFRWLE